MTTILGFVLENNPDLASDIRDSALAQFPVVGPQLATSSEPLTGNRSRWSSASSARSGPGWARPRPARTR